MTLNTLLTQLTLLHKLLTDAGRDANCINVYIHRHGKEPVLDLRDDGSSMDNLDIYISERTKP